MSEARNRIAGIAALVLLAGSAAFVVFVTMPRARAMRAIGAEIEMKEAFIQEANRARQLRERLQVELDETSNYAREQSDQIIKPGKLPILFGKISRLAQSNKLATPKIEPQQALEYDSVHKVPIGLGISGSFAGIYGFIRELEAMTEQVWISEFKLIGPREIGKPVECELTLVVFIDNPEKTN